MIINNTSIANEWVTIAINHQAWRNLSKRSDNIQQSPDWHNYDSRKDEESLSTLVWTRHEVQ